MSQPAQDPDPGAAPERQLSVAPDTGKTPYPNWARFMKKLIAKQGGSQGAVAKGMKTSQTQISRWARGLARPATMEGALELVAAVGGDVQAAQVAWNADAPLQRGGRRARKAAKTTRKKPGPKPGSTRKVSGSIQRSTPVQPVSPPSSTRATQKAVPAEESLRGIGLAQQALTDAERLLDDAVNAARAAGHSWPEIAKALSAN